MASLESPPSIWKAEQLNFRYDIEENKYDEKEILSQNEIPRMNIDMSIDPYPSYIYKALWHKSDDEKLELLIDDAVRKVSQLDCWGKRMYMEMLFNDGRYKNSQATKTYYDFVKYVYKNVDIGADRFFDKFITKHYSREIKVHNAKGTRYLKTNKEINAVLMKIKFDTKSLDYRQFQQSFEELGYTVHSFKLRDIFNEISPKDDPNASKITFKEFKKYRSTLRNINSESFTANSIQDEIKEGTDSEDLVYVYYNHYKKRYEFSRGKDKKKEPSKFIMGDSTYQKIAELEIQIDEDMKWAVFVNRLKTSQNNRFKMYEKGIKPNGYWRILKDQHDENKYDSNIASSVRDDMAPTSHLNIFYSLLNHYYVMNTKKEKKAAWRIDNTPLRKLYCRFDDEIKFERRVSRIDKTITLFIEGIEYQITWWNEQDKYETNAIALINFTNYEQRRYENNLLLGQNDDNVENNSSDTDPIELCYLRFDYNSKVAKEKLQWQWWDNDPCIWRPFEQEDAVTMQLEASYLSNQKQQFDPVTFAHRFSNCLLTELKEHFRTRSNADYKDFMFRAIISPKDEKDEWSYVILSMEQMTFDHQKNSTFSRPIKRLYEKRDSLDFIHHTKKDKVYRQWKVKYRLYTEQQQLYFFSYIVSIVCILRIIEIEFSNQLVLIPGDENDNNDGIEDVIQTNDVRREQEQCEIFKGSLIPPSGRWAEGCHRLADNKPSKTKTLKKAFVAKTKPLKKTLKTFSNKKGLQMTDEKEDIDEKSDGEELEVHRNDSAIKILNECIYVQDEKDIKVPLYFSKDEADFLRLMECIRKYVLESEAGEENKMWPWYMNSFHTSDQYTDAQNYDDLIYKFGLKSTWTIHELVTCFRKNRQHVQHNEDETKEEDSGDPIRFRRKFAARMLLNPPLIARNINLIRNQLKPLLDQILDDIMDQDDGEVKEDKYTELVRMIKKFDMHFTDKEKQELIDKFCVSKINSNQHFWPQQIEKINKDFQRKEQEGDKYGLFDENIDNLETLNIDRFTLPIFDQFVQLFFINSDKEEYENMHTTADKPISNYLGGEQQKWYRAFLGSWRQIPKWYTYDHDILLLELVLRNGLYIDKIIKDLEGERMSQYKIRLQSQNNIMDDPYYEFKGWCTNETNILHRLKYITNIIVKNLQNTKYGGETPLINIRIPQEMDRPTYNISSLLYTDYQKDTYFEYVSREPDIFSLEKITENDEDQQHHGLEAENDKNCCDDCCGKIFQNICCWCQRCKKGRRNNLDTYSLLPQLTFDDEEEIKTPSFVLSKQIKATGKKYIRRLSMCMQQKSNNMGSMSMLKSRCIDPFIHRDVDFELLDTLRSFDLYIHGVALVHMIINQLQTQNRDAYWKCFGVLMKALPYPIAISVMKKQEIKDVLRHAEPAVLEKICCQLLEGSLFQAAAALEIADFLDSMAQADIIQADIWEKYSKKFELKSFRAINFARSDHLLYVLLNLPLKQLRGESILNLALQQEQSTFVNNNGIKHAINHSLEIGTLSPLDNVQINPWTYKEMLNLILCHPFRFYFSARGYNWVSGISFMMYFIYICAYIYTRPFDVQQMKFVDYTEDIILWTSNLGYILYELLECADKGVKKYLCTGKSNALDIAICLIWIVLFAMRMILINKDVEFDKHETTMFPRLYVFLFGCQIILLTMRSFELFSSSESLGILVKAIKLMASPIIKILFIYFIGIAGFLFGLWAIAAINKCAYYPDAEECEDYEAVTIFHGLIYVFQVFIGTGDLSGTGQDIDEEPFAVIMMILATIFGTIILTNLLIALMTTEYESVEEQAKSQVIYNKAELASDLSTRHRLMPPPLNIVVLVVTLVIDVFNLFYSLIIDPIGLNIYWYIDHQFFLNLKGLNIWKCKRKYKEKTQKSRKTKFKNRSDILEWYFVAPYNDWIKPIIKGDSETDKDILDNDNDWRIFHKACYGYLIAQPESDKDIGGTIAGLTMEQYFTKYERKRRQKLKSDVKAVFKQLTTNTLFCECCYRSFNKDNIRTELTTPYIALLDVVSAITFVLIPIAWIPLILMFGLFALKDAFFGGDIIDISDDDDESYSKDDFDSEYFPERYKM